MNKILVTGGAGYVGARLVPELVKEGYEVNVLDWFIYKPTLFDDLKESVTKIKGDLRSQSDIEASLEGVDKVIHLACISNDPSAELNKDFTLDVNQNGFRTLLEICRKIDLDRFIFASSSSIYGISDSLNVYEDHPRVPISLYNISKAWCEDLLFSEFKDLPFSIIRPATICGYSERQRLDLAVNLLTSHAIQKKQINIFGGDQHRPNLNIKDMVDLYLYFLKIDKNKIHHEIFNASYGNLTITEIANSISDALEPKIGKIEMKWLESDDPRSYRVNSDKLFSLGFKPKFNIEDAVIELHDAFKKKKILGDVSDPIFNNVQMMKNLELK
jgi:nucleoside-diphosphate-sugar epimerase